MESVLHKLKIPETYATSFISAGTSVFFSVFFSPLTAIYCLTSLASSAASASVLKFQKRTRFSNSSAFAA
jgi:hypothetical protein